jgi:hypothetical protein
MDMIDIVKLVDDPARTPVFAGQVALGRVYMRDFVVCNYEVLALCNSATVNADAKTFDGPNWTVLSKRFDPKSMYELNVIRYARPLLTLRDAYITGWSASTKHPNRIYRGHDNAERYFCNDCLLLDPEQYSVQESVWTQAVTHTSPCKLCLDCLARRLRRDLLGSDFTASRKNNLLRLGLRMGKSPVATRLHAAD